ncbi:tail fiber domain-containing protein [Chitinophaga sp. CB10]|uniref:tail fiber domain-containing protein n=1 Tax=Chitinophaga sp. CB10 TaxID=1891659 RepID=UPI0025C4D2FA|nr:tail fiber domain-containing protein [Chitinophaga sp. CB10]
MKYLFLSLALLVTFNTLSAQKIYQIRADSVRIYNICDTAELILENCTQDTIGYLYNKSKGRTEFRRIRLEQVGDSKIAIPGQDTIDLSLLTGLTINSADFIRNQAFSDQIASFRLKGEGILSVLQVSDNVTGPDTKAYAPLGVTRPGDLAGDLAYIALSRLGQKVWQMGINTENSFILGGSNGYGSWTMLPHFIINGYGNVTIGNGAGAVERLNVGGAASFGRPGLYGYTKLEEAFASMEASSGSIGFYLADGTRGGYIDYGGANMNYVLADTTTVAGKSNRHRFFGRLMLNNHKSYGLLRTNTEGEIVNGENDFIKNQYVNPQPANIYLSGRATVSAGEVVDEGLIPDTYAYSPFGITRARGGNLSYLSFTQSGYLNWGQGLNNDGNLIIGMAVTPPSTGIFYPRELTPMVTIDKGGNIIATGAVQATGITQTSLRSLKKDIAPFSRSALAILKEAQVRTFRYKADSSNKIYIGFIADEVPEEMSASGKQGVDHASAVGLLVRSVQELSEKNDSLQKENQQLKSTLADVLSRLDALEKK